MDLRRMKFLEQNMVYNNCNTTTSTSVKWQVTIFALPEGVHDKKGMTKRSNWPEWKQ